MGSKAKPTTKNRTGLGSLSREECLRIYRLMFTSRAIDDAEIKLKRKNQIFFQISGAGHEAVGAVAGLSLKPGHDWFYTYYRDRAFCLAIGVTPYEMFLSAVGSIDDPASGGRQMPSHWGKKSINLVSNSSPTGMQMLHAAGTADACRYATKFDGLDSEFHGDEVIFASLGDGTTSQGEFWESMSTICTRKLPVLVLVEDNEYAISTPVEVQTPGGDISALFMSYPGLLIRKVDGCDPVACHDVFKEVVAHIRAGKGPALIHASTIRPYSHSMSDDHRAYRTQEELEVEEARDPLPSFEKRLLDAKVATKKELSQIRDEVVKELAEAEDRAILAPRPGPEDAPLFVYSPDVDPTSAEFETAPASEGDPVSMVDLINRCLHDEMARNPNIVVFGQDVADASRADVLERIKGKGGVFKLTSGLQTTYGKDRVYNSPLAEANIVGRAVGMALAGLKPVVEVQFYDYIWPAYNQIRNELAMMRWRSRNKWKSPLVIRVPIGGYLQGGAIYHSQSGVVLMTHNPGLRVIMPSNALDANGLLRTAVRCDDPVLFLEHKHLYRQPYAKAPYPGDNYMIPFGRGRIHREGTDISIITYGALVRRSEMAAKALEKEGLSIEIIDLRSLAPWDREMVADSVRKTSKVIVAYEDPISFGYGAEIAAWISDELFEDLDGPVKRVATADRPVGYNPILEDATLPQTDDIMRAARDLWEY